MRPPDFTLSMWGFVVPLNRGENMAIAVVCGRCRRELTRRVVRTGDKRAYDLAEDLSLVWDHYQAIHLNVVTMHGGEGAGE